MFIYLGHAKIVQLLIRHGANVNAGNESKVMPLHNAAYFGKLNLIL